MAAAGLEALGLVEIRGWSASLAALDAIEKSANIRLLQVELNDLYGACIKFAGNIAAVESGTRAGKKIADMMQVDCVAKVIAVPDVAAQAAWTARADFNPLIEQPTVHIPHSPQETTMTQPNPDAPFALGIIETQGLTAVIEAIDTACKAANVEILGREKLGGGYIAVMIKGDVAAVRAAVDAGKAKVDGLGKLIAAHVIPRPSSAVLSLLAAARM